MLLHFCSEASLNTSEPAFLSVKHFPFPHFFSRNVGYSMLASPCFTSPSVGSHSVLGGQHCSEVLARTPKEKRAQTAALDSGRSTLSKTSVVGSGLCYALGLGPISMATSCWTQEKEGQRLSPLRGDRVIYCSLHCLLLFPMARTVPGTLRWREDGGGGKVALGSLHSCTPSS